jgi:hypothetical protein
MGDAESEVATHCAGAQDDRDSVTHVYLTWSGEEHGAMARALSGYPAVLVALPWLTGYLKSGLRPSREMLDSGAFSAWNSGKVIDIAELISVGSRARWTESVGLDVIGSWQGSKQNAIRMRVLGSSAMPVFHVGDPWELLAFYCKHWPKVGLGGMVGRGGRGRAVGLHSWLSQVFARAWPYRFHAFGQTGADVLLRYPFHSADSSSWAVPVLRNRDYVHVRGAKVGKAYGITRALAGDVLRYNVDRYAVLADRLASHWRSDLAKARSTCEYTGD